MGLGRASMPGAIGAQGLFLARTRWGGVKEHRCTDTDAGRLSNPRRSFKPGSDLG
jgi:hypothetical protein